MFGPFSSHERVYDECAADVVACPSGRQRHVFVYGQTGSGKRQKMEGSVEDSHHPALLRPYLFGARRQHSGGGRGPGPPVVKVSYAEIYNEKIRDLLVRPQDAKALRVREDSKGRRFFVEGLTFSIVKNSAECMAVFEEGKEHRAVGSTDMNANSSRSHAIFSIVVERTTISAAGALVARCGKLSLVDLAGSERASTSFRQTAKQRMSHAERRPSTAASRSWATCSRP